MRYSAVLAAVFCVAMANSTDSSFWHLTTSEEEVETDNSSLTSEENEDDKPILWGNTEYWMFLEDCVDSSSSILQHSHNAVCHCFVTHLSKNYEWNTMVTYTQEIMEYEAHKILTCKNMVGDG